VDRRDAEAVGEIGGRAERLEQRLVVRSDRA
jgi:hypothetical protein